MELSRFKKLKDLLDQKKILLREFYKSDEFYLALRQIRKEVEEKSVICLESEERSSLIECTINSILLVDRENVFKMYNHKIPSFHLFYEELVISKFYQETVSYSVQLKKDFLYQKGNGDALILN